jgi:hypothetical protein
MEETITRYGGWLAANTFMYVIPFVCLSEGASLTLIEWLRLTKFCGEVGETVVAVFDTVFSFRYDLRLKKQSNIEHIKSKTQRSQMAALRYMKLTLDLLKQQRNEQLARVWSSA